MWVDRGDGGFQMTLMRALHRAPRNGIKVNVAVINNGFLGMVRQWQEFFFGGRYAGDAAPQPRLRRRLRRRTTGCTEHPRRAAFRGRRRPFVAGPKPTRSATVVIDFRVETGGRGLPDGPGWREPPRHDPAAEAPLATRRITRSSRRGRTSDEQSIRQENLRSVSVEDKPRRAQPRRVALPPPQLQHRLAQRRVATHEPGVSRMTIVCDADRP